MTRKFIMALLWGLLSLSFAQADTIIPGGNVSGTWTAAGSPYLVQGDITVHADSTLTIEPAAEVEFQGDYSLTVNGFLQAIGTEVDSIHFSPADTSIGWGGITFQNAPDSSHLTYCSISNAATGVSCFNSNAVISHSTIILSSSNAIALGNSSPEISHCHT